MHHFILAATINDREIEDNNSPFQDAAVIMNVDLSGSGFKVYSHMVFQSQVSRKFMVIGFE